MTTTAQALTTADRAESATRALPPLLVEAERVAASVILGDHGRKRAGPGESFWQYRPYSFGDSTHRIDWHRSARSDRVFIRENEWEAANTLWLWAASHPGMDFRSPMSRTIKRDRAQVVALAAGVLATHAHERVGAIGAPFGCDHARSHIIRIAQWFLGRTGEALPPSARATRLSGALLVSDFFEGIAEIAAAIMPMAEAGVHGHLVQVVDPAEEVLPYAGRVEFQEMAGPLKFLASRTETLRQPYRERLEGHRAELGDLCRRIGWSLTIHRTDQPLPALLMNLHALISGGFGR